MVKGIGQTGWESISTLPSYLHPSVFEITIQSWLCDMYHIADLLNRKVSLCVQTGREVSFFGIKDFGPASLSSPGSCRFEPCFGSFLGGTVQRYVKFRSLEKVSNMTETRRFPYIYERHKLVIAPTCVADHSERHFRHRSSQPQQFGVLRTLNNSYETLRTFVRFDRKDAKIQL